MPFFWTQKSKGHNTWHEGSIWQNTLLSFSPSHLSFLAHFWSTCRFNTEASKHPFFSCSNPSPHQSLPPNTIGRMPAQLFFALALRHRLHFSSPGFSLTLWSSSLRWHDSSLTPHSAMCRENYLFSCCRGVKAKLSWESRAAQGSRCSYSLQQQLALVQHDKSSEDA